MHTQVNEERLGAVVLAWLWCQQGKAATAAAVASGVKSVLPAGSAGQLVPAALDRLVQGGQAERIEPAKKSGKPTFRITAGGERRARELLQREGLPAGARPFGTISSYDLPALAAGLPRPPSKKAEGAFSKLVPIAVCVRHEGLDVPLDRGPDAAKEALVKLALSRFNDVPVERIHLGKKLPGGAVPALVVRPILGEAAKSATAATNLDKLIGASAGHILNGCKPAQVKAAVVGRWVGDGDSRRSASAPHGDGPPATPNAATEPAPEVDLPTFADQALAAAREVAGSGREGVSNLRDKVLVHFAWRRYQQRFGSMPLDRFKQRLSEANGEHIVLVREDLVPGERAQEFRESEVRTGASSYHYIRI